MGTARGRTSSPWGARGACVRTCVGEKEGETRAQSAGAAAGGPGRGVAGGASGGVKQEALGQRRAFHKLGTMGALQKERGAGPGPRKRPQKRARGPQRAFDSSSTRTMSWETHGQGQKCRQESFLFLPPRQAGRDSRP